VHGKVGERYILGGQDVLLADMLRDIAHLVGRKPPRLRMPRRLLYPAAAMAEMIANRTGREPFLTLDGLRMAKHRMFFTSAKATRDLGFVARPYAEGLRDAVEWFRGAGHLR
jgi:dihydroflavonol-4-reductase